MILNLKRILPSSGEWKKKKLVYETKNVWI